MFSPEIIFVKSKTGVFIKSIWQLEFINSCQFWIHLFSQRTLIEGCKYFQAANEKSGFDFRCFSLRFRSFSIRILPRV